MASATIAPYKSNSAQTTFSLVGNSSTGASWKLAGRNLSEPYSVEIVRKLSPSGSLANDVVLVRQVRVERNTTTGKLATMLIETKISIPKDDSVLTATAQLEGLACQASLLNDCTAMAATTVNRTALIEGRDF